MLEKRPPTRLAEGGSNCFPADIYLIEPLVRLGKQASRRILCAIDNKREQHRRRVVRSEGDGAVAGRRPFREAAEKRTVCISLKFAIIGAAGKANAKIILILSANRTVERRSEVEIAVVCLKSR